MILKNCYDTYLKIRFHFKDETFNYLKHNIKNLNARYEKEPVHVKRILQSCARKYTKKQFTIRCLVAAVHVKRGKLYPTHLVEKIVDERYSEFIRYFSNIEYFLELYYTKYKNCDNIYEMNIPFYILSILHNWFDHECNDSDLLFKLNKFRVVYKNSYENIRRLK